MTTILIIMRRNPDIRFEFVTIDRCLYLARGSTVIGKPWQNLCIVVLKVLVFGACLLYDNASSPV